MLLNLKNTFDIIIIMKNKNTQNDLFDTPPQIYDIDYVNENLEEVLSKATDVAYVYVPDPRDPFHWGLITDEYPNIKKVHIFTSILCKRHFKQVENDSRYDILYIDGEQEKDPFKFYDVKFDYIYINRFDLAFQNPIDYDPILNMKILNDAIEHLKDENSILVNDTEEDECVVYKKGKQQVNNQINF